MCSFAFYNREGEERGAVGEGSSRQCREGLLVPFLHGTGAHWISMKLFMCVVFVRKQGRKSTQTVTPPCNLLFGHCYAKAYPLRQYKGPAPWSHFQHLNLKEREAANSSALVQIEIEIPKYFILFLSVTLS